MPSSIIGNNHISCTIDSQGAQMVSLRSKASGKEYIWQGNPDIWKWHAPVLFPFCGNFPEGFMYNGKKYHLPQHGFLRNVEHTRISDGVYVFETSGLDDYPFALRATTSFLLDCSTLTHRVEIENTGNESLPFSLGFHTGFALSNARLEFEKAEEELGSNEFIADDKSLASTKLYTKIRSGFIDCTGTGGKRIRWESSGYSTLVLWTAPGHSRDYICIEPRIDTVPEGAKKPFKCKLQPRGKTTLEERITILA
ncbi:MAG: hypothetical protein IKP61_09215 [Spirochaetales bacterium]|nr:hypothetical protein [Spirochaetales bacterium]